jgi:hypothetical protein
LHEKFHKRRFAISIKISTEKQIIFYHVFLIILLTFRFRLSSIAVHFNNISFIVFIFTSFLHQQASRSSQQIIECNFLHQLTQKWMKKTALCAMSLFCSFLPCSWDFCRFHWKSSLWSCRVRLSFCLLPSFFCVYCKPQITEGISTISHNSSKICLIDYQTIPYVSRVKFYSTKSKTVSFHFEFLYILSPNSVKSTRFTIEMHRHQNYANFFCWFSLVTVENFHGIFFLFVFRTLRHKLTYS